MKEVKRYQPKDVAGKLAVGFLHNPLTPILGIFLLIIGYISLEIMPREEDPQIAVAGGTIIVPMPGATPREVENIIVNPLERKIREIKGVEHVYGIAMNNVGVVNVMYFIGEDREKANLNLYDKVMQNMDLLPKGTMQPIVKPFDVDIDIPIMSITFYKKDSASISDAELFKIVREIQQDLNRIENVSKTEIKGGRKEQYNIEVDLGKLSGYHLSLGQIVQAIKALAVDVPDVKGRTQDGKLVIFGVKNAIESVHDVENLIVAQYRGSPIYLKNIAKVSAGSDIQNFKSVEISERKGDTFTPLKPAVTLTLGKLAGANAVVIADEVKMRMQEYKPLLENNGIGFTITRDYGKRANDAVNELVDHILITIVIISVMLVFFLGWKESIIVTFTVPAILAITLFIAYLSGQTINRITLFAFLLSLGLLVDAAIIVIENIHRHLHNHDAVDKDMDEIMVEATDEIGAPTNIATLAIILTMVPMAFVGGMMGQFMKPIPANVPVALVASLIVAYIFTPYLGRRLLKKPHMHHHKHHFQKDEVQAQGGAK
ncbi:efflux RND transporter permease subunit [Hydrogenimonas thermophila]|uniref:AcrB/AcrD/AcrF family protein n=1 Tax=Hydrogenimonas thermophila TaxID=223786 RepID=A0A1I5QU76_9BACT|nr:efflux RND transporter permease subunit [Hydrogenimonas thermophila]SFP49396.1 AcrB/AcrD/AcrF family protein [Hydrogenimonas thermophila]